MRNRNFWLSVGLLAGNIIGAGVFSLPFVFKTAGLSTGIFYLILAAGVYIAVYWMYAEIILRTPGHHRFVGYMEKYLGKNVSFFAILISVVQVVFVLTIYLVLSQSFSNLIIDFGIGVEKMIIFWVIGSATIFLGIKRIAWMESLVTLGIILLLAVIFILGVFNGNYLKTVEILPAWGSVFLPLGAVLFSLAGRQAIPDMLWLSKNYKKSIFVGVLIPVLVYLLFIISVLALSPVVTEDSVSGLAGTLPGLVFIGMIGIFGILSILSSYGEVGRDVYESLEYDLKLPFWPRFLIIVFGPIGLYFSGLQNFLQLVGFVGGIFLALEGILIVAAWLKATGKRPGLGTSLIIAIFAVAILYEIIK